MAGLSRLLCIAFVLAVAPSGTAEDQRTRSPHAALADGGTEHRVIRVGPAGDVPTIAAASRVARSGDVIEIEAGDYVGDVAVWAVTGAHER